MKRYIVFGILIGALFGYFINFTQPNFLLQELQFNILQRKELGYSPDYYSPKSGSFFVVGNLIPLVFGIIGGLIGLILYIIKDRLQKVK